MAIQLPAKPIHAAVKAMLASLGVDGVSPNDISDHDIRRASKAAKRVIELLEELAEAVEKFERDFTTAEAKTPKKKLLAEIEKAIHSDPENFEKVVKALDDVIRGNLRERTHESRPEKAARRIPDTADNAAAVSGGGRAAAAGAARPPRRRQKPIDPIVAAMRQSDD
jgi:tyrosyl-tRNA synthetase